MVYVKDCLPHRLLQESCYIKDGVEVLSLNVFVKKRQCNIITMYKPPNVTDSAFGQVFTELCDLYINDTSLTIFVGDFNYNMKTHNFLKDLCDLYDLTNMIKEPTCFKSDSPSILDLILTDKPRSLSGTINTDIGLSDFHNVIAVATKLHAQPRIKRKVIYRSMKHFDENEFQGIVENAPFGICNIFDDCDDRAWAHSVLFKTIIDECAPLKNKTVQGKQLPYMNKQIRQAKYTRNMWRNKHFRYRKDKLYRENMFIIEIKSSVFLRNLCKHTSMKDAKEA